jgi:hypothetical protein
LVVDPDAKLTGAASSQSFQPVPRRIAQVVKAFGNIQQPQLPQGGALDFQRPPPGRTAIRHSLRVTVCERADHECPKQ